MKTIVKIGLLLFGLVSYGSLFGQEQPVKIGAKPLQGKLRAINLEATPHLPADKVGGKKEAPVKKKAAPQKLQPVTNRETY